MKIAHKNYSFFCFDFDGVILDTIELKAEGFAHAFGKISNANRSIIFEYQKKHGGEDRTKKFIHLSRLIGEDDPSIERLNSLSASLTEYVMEGIKRAKYIEGFSNFLGEARKVGMPCAVAMPQLELHKILDLLEIKTYFEMAFGMPVPKPQNLLLIKDVLTTRHKPGLYFGDNLSDFEAAQKAGLDFLGVGRNPIFDSMEIKSVTDFRDVTLD